MDSIAVSNVGMKFGLIFFSSSEAPFSGDKYRLVIESARYADQHGFSSVWIPERHFTKDGWLYPNPAVLQAALARETSQIGLRAGSVVMPLHDPIRVAEEWAMVDNLSGGRVGLSFASGWHPNDFVFFPDHYEKRQEVMYRGIETVQKLWRGESIQAKGGDGKLVEIRTYPTPVQPELPIWVTAAGNPKTFAGAGEVGANLLTHLFNQSIEQLAEKIQIYRDSLAKHGYDPQAGQVSVMIHTFVGEDETLVRDQVYTPFSTYLKSGSYLVDAIAYSRGQKIDMSSLSEQDLNDYLRFVFDRLVSSQRVLFGTPESCLDSIVQLKAAGVDEVACQLDFGLDLQLALASLPSLNRLQELSAAKLAAQAPASPPYQLDDPAPIKSTNGHASSQNIHPDSPSTAAPRPNLPVGTASARPPQLSDIQQRCREEVSIANFYRRLHMRGIQLGASFQGIEQLWRGEGEALGCVQSLERLSQDAAQYQIHPTLLDSCFQVLIAALPTSAWQSDSALYLPTGLGSFQMHQRPAGQVWSHAVLTTNNAADGLFEGEVCILDEAGSLLAEARGLRLQRSELAGQPAPAEALTDWLYSLNWEPITLSPAAQQPLQQTGKWLIFMDGSGVGRKLAEQLALRGEMCFAVVPGSRYSVLEPGIYQIDPAQPDQMRQVVQEVLQAGTMPLRGVVHLWSLDATPPAQTTAASLQADQVLGTGHALSVIQALLTVQSVEPPRLWLLTRGAQPVGEQVGPLAVSQSPLWGLGKTCAMEQPELWGGLIDLDPQVAADETVQQLLPVLTHAQVEGKEDLLAFRQGQIYAARMVRRREWPRRELPLRADASYLITGGLWGLGLTVAGWLVEKGARHLVLLGRTQLPAREQWSTVAAESRLGQQIAGIRRLEQAGAQVYYAAVDVADEQQLSDFLRIFAHQGRPAIRGVMHAASVWQDAQGHSLVRPLANLDSAALEAVFKPKMLGGWLLHSLLRDANLDFFVSFSSGASLFGSAAQGNYAAAGEFLDVLAYQQRAQGQTALSIDWGAVSQTGFGTTAEGQRVHEYWEARGIQRITPAQVLAALDLLIPQDAARVGVLKLDWPLLRATYPQITSLPLLKYLVAETGASAEQAEAASTEQSAILQQLLQAPDAERRSLMVTYLCEHVAGVLRVPPARLDIEQPLTALGLDSLMAIELKNRIERELKVRIPIVTFLQGPSIAQFADQILAQLAEQPEISPAASKQRTGEVDAEQLLAQLDQLSDSEVEGLLSQMLQEQPEQQALSQHDAEQLLAQLDQLPNETIDALLSQMVQNEDR